MPARNQAASSNKLDAEGEWRMRLFFPRVLTVLMVVVMVAGTASAQPVPTKPASEDAPGVVTAEAATY
jgi:hypothetical protein